MPADTVAVAKDMLHHLNSWPDKPCNFAMEELPKKSPAIMLQPVAGSGVERRYIDGSFIGLFSFAVYLRSEQTDTHEKLSAYDTLEQLAYWLENSALPSLSGRRTAIKIEQSTTTALALLDDDTEDYQTVFSLRYRQSA